MIDVAVPNGLASTSHEGRYERLAHLFVDGRALRPRFG
jgi:hypothetical protein